jgi:thiamine biosynthesis lipoprotein
MRAGLVVLLAAPLLLGSRNTLQRFEFSEPHMGTLVRIVLYAKTEAQATSASKDAFARIAMLDEMLSDYRDTSEVTRLSRATPGEAVPISDELMRVLRASQAMARASDGAFDVTAGPLTMLWRAARRHHEAPDSATLDEARTRVGYERLHLDEQRRAVTLRSTGMQIDLGGIAKGFAADAAAATLAVHGVNQALIAAGGDIVVRDAPPGAAGWRVAIAGIERSNGGELTLANAAVSTSGDAEQFVELQGVRYSHIIDPRTGRALTGRSSVTVVANDGTTSDSLATAVSVMGPEAGLRLVDATPGACARFTRIEHEPRVYTSTRWREN